MNIINRHAPSRIITNFASEFTLPSFVPYLWRQNLVKISEGGYILEIPSQKITEKGLRTHHKQGY